MSTCITDLICYLVLDNTYWQKAGTWKQGSLDQGFPWDDNLFLLSRHIPLKEGQLYLNRFSQEHTTTQSIPSCPWCQTSIWIVAVPWRAHTPDLHSMERWSLQSNQFSFLNIGMGNYRITCNWGNPDSTAGIFSSTAKMASISWISAQLNLLPTRKSWPCSFRTCRTQENVAEDENRTCDAWQLSLKAQL